MEIFKTNSDYCFGKNVDDKEHIDIKKCSYLERMLHGLKYYKLLSLEINTSNKEIFISFYQTVYTQLLNDYQHIISIHQQQIEDIHNKLITDENYGNCKHSDCTLYDRYHRREVGNNNNHKQEMDTKIIFYKDIFNSMHNFLYHHIYTLWVYKKSKESPGKNKS